MTYEGQYSTFHVKRNIFFQLFDLYGIYSKTTVKSINY